MITSAILTFCIATSPMPRSPPDRIDNAIRLLERCPSFEFLCMMTLSPDTFLPVYGDYVVSVCPRPLSECKPEMVYKILGQLDDLSTAELRQVVKTLSDRIELFEQDPDRGKEGFMRIQPSLEDDKVRLLVRDHTRRIGMLLPYLFAVPKNMMYPWKSVGKTLRFYPSSQGLPVMLQGSYLGAGVDRFDEYAKRYGRRNKLSK